MDSNFQTLMAQNILTGVDAMISFAECQDGAPMQVDLSQGVVMLGDIGIPVSAVGTWAKAPTDSWLWAWANPGWQDLPASVMSAAKNLQEYGTTNGIGELTASEIPMDNDTFGFQAVAVASGLTNAAGAFQYAHSGGSAFFVTHGELPKGSSDGIERHLSVIAQGLQAYELPHHLATTSYLAQKGYSLEQPDPQTVVALRDGNRIELAFDDLGRLKDMQFKTGV